MFDFVFNKDLKIIFCDYFLIIAVHLSPAGGRLKVHYGEHDQAGLSAQYANFYLLSPHCPTSISPIKQFGALLFFSSHLARLLVMVNFESLINGNLLLPI